MFAPLRCRPDEEPLLAIQETKQLPAQGQGHQHQACYHCREKKLKCTAQKTGCDRCVAQGIVCTFKPLSRRRDSILQQKRGGGTAFMRRSEAIRAPTPSKNVAPQALVRKSKPSPTNNSSGTFGESTPGLTNDSSSSSSLGRLQTPQGNGQFQGTPNGVWQMSSMGLENATMAQSLNGTDFDLPQTKSPGRLEDFSNDAEFDAFGLDQDDDQFSDIMDLDFGFSDFMTQDGLEISAVRKPSTLESGDKRAVASLLQSPQAVQVNVFPPGPPQPSWTSFERSESTSSKSHHSTIEAKTSFSQKPMQCDWLKTTLSLLENVQFREPHASASTLIHMLHEFKQWINFFKGVASCTACKFVTDSLMLLVVVCEKLADSFRVVLNVYEKLAETMSETSGVPPEARMFSGEYRIDFVEELACLFM